MSIYYRNADTDQVVKYAKPDARLEFLENWTQLSDAQVAKLDESKVEEPVVFSQIGEVSEDVNAHGAGTERVPTGLNEDKGNGVAADGDGDGGNKSPERPTEDNKADEIDAYAKANEIDLGGAKTKAEKIALINAWHDAK